MSSKPSFTLLVLCGLASVEITYISMEHLRKAKKNLMTQRECLELCKAIYDLILIYLSDFRCNYKYIQFCNTEPQLSEVLFDSTEQAIRMEIIYCYLYTWELDTIYLEEWNVYTHSDESKCNDSPPDQRIILIALAFVLARINFFHHQNPSIIKKLASKNPIHNEVQKEWTLVKLPPYPNYVILDMETRYSILNEIVDEWQTFNVHSELTEHRVHQIHQLFGRLRYHVKELDTYQRYYHKLFHRIHQQNDQNLSIYLLQMLSRSERASTKQILQLHLSWIEIQLRLMDEETNFFKWITSIVRDISEKPKTPRCVSTFSECLDAIPSALKAAWNDLQQELQRCGESSTPREECKNQVKLTSLEKCFKDSMKLATRSKNRQQLELLHVKMRSFTQQIIETELNMNTITTPDLKGPTTCASNSDQELLELKERVEGILIELCDQVAAVFVN
uniref:AlNc14C325G10632 protein n=1 Tax=Albugo laibachii Nc14 TaxID=890382 RepID=F0WWM0_9STRA|nr:AlNc14C325G10632 [Albugo laibachii Nc14]|eukprot:CCA25844.1 AlNc14C325G10632 [Albugo laibachii Nc14]